MTRRTLGLGLVVATVAALSLPLLASTPAQAATPLRTSAAAKGKFIGFAAATGPLANETAYRNIAATEFSQVTPENALKWDATESVDNQYTFSGADQVVAFAQANNQVVHGHTLVWHNQTPGWVQGLGASAMRTAMQDHIATVVGRYASNPIVQSWDVVNEAFDENGGMRTSFWYNTLGSGYIADAFRYARAADSDAQLCINDYNVEGVNAKSTAMYNLVSSLKSQGVPIDCVGLQTHLATQYGFPSTMQQNIQRFANLGVKVRITELDVRIVMPRDSAKDNTQAQYYTNVVNACLAVTACTGITIWGFTDKYSWVPDTFPSEGAALIYDANYSAKAAYTAISNAFGPGPSDTTPPSTPSNLSAAAVTHVSFTLSWTGSTDNVGVTGYDVYQNGTLIQSTPATVAGITGLTPATTYQFTVRAKDAAGNVSSASTALSVTTANAPSDTSPPTAPSNLAASSVGSTSLTLSWTGSTDNVGVTGYDIFRNGTLLTSVTGTSASITGLTAATAYQFYVRAKDAAGNVSTSSNTVSVTTTGGSSGGCTAVPTVQSSWQNGYVIQPLTITNTGTSTISSWTVVFTLPSGHAITGSWNATLTVSGQTVTARGLSYNSTLSPGASTSFGFQASRPNGDTSTPSTYTCSTP